MKEKDFERIEEIMQSKLDQQTETFQGYLGVISDDFQHKLDIVVEGHQLLDNKIGRQDKRLNDKIDRLDERLVRVEGKVDMVAEDLAEHRRDTEAHKDGYKAMDPNRDKGD